VVVKKGKEERWRSPFSQDFLGGTSTPGPGWNPLLVRAPRRVGKDGTRTEKKEGSARRRSVSATEMGGSVLLGWSKWDKKNGRRAYREKNNDVRIASPSICTHSWGESAALRPVGGRERIAASARKKKNFPSWEALACRECDKVKP